MGRPPRLHGPYHQWTYKVAGRTKTMRLSEDQARLCQAWLRNHKQLKRLVRQMEQLSLRETDRILGAISRR
jgi:phenylpropionate dioxygenase-like ring-hydroxylating dioxygenase large terminal subunit